MNWRGYVIRRVVLTTCKQAEGARLVDACWGSGESRADNRGLLWFTQPLWLAPVCDFKFKGRAILLKPWQKNMRGRRRMQRALVVGWITERRPLDA